MSNLKYIEFKNNQNNENFIILFPNFIQHSDMSKIFVTDIKPISAGFVTFKEDSDKPIITWGESISLHLKANNNHYDNSFYLNYSDADTYAIIDFMFLSNKPLNNLIKQYFINHGMLLGEQSFSVSKKDSYNQSLDLHKIYLDVSANKENKFKNAIQQYPDNFLLAKGY